jgi:multidrug efflux system membrane fusion protein
MRRIVRNIAVAIGVLLVAGGLIWGFVTGRGGQAAEAQRDAPLKAASRVSTEDGRTFLSFDPAAQRGNGIVTTILTATTQRAEAQATGVVVQLQPLLDLRASYNTPATDLLRARASARASSAEYQRLRSLNQDGRNAADKAVEAARAAAENDAALVQNAQQAITILNGNAVLRWGPVVAGWIRSNSPQLDALLMQRAFLLQVTTTTDGRFASPRRAVVQYPDGTHATAQFVSVLPQVDPRFQVPSLLYLVAPHAGLVPGVNVSVFLPSGKEQTGIVIPSSAVVWSLGSAWCYVEQSPGKFERIAVETGTPQTHGWFVTHGVEPGAHVVTSGAQTLLSEEFRSQIQANQD